MPTGNGTHQNKKIMIFQFSFSKNRQINIYFKIEKKVDEITHTYRSSLAWDKISQVSNEDMHHSWMYSFEPN
jgi:hypothetical protein